MSRDFLQRWSRRKRAATSRAALPAASEPSPALPALDSVTFESDFKAFMQARVDEGLRRAALRKLFSDPRWNVMDGLDIYIGDYSIEDPIAPGVLAQLDHARTTLLGPATEVEPEPGQIAVAKELSTPSSEEAEQ